MYSVLNKLAFKNELIGLRILVECSAETDKEEILDLDMDLVYQYEIDYEAYDVEQLEIIERKGVYATEQEHQLGVFVRNTQDFYTNRENFIKDIYENIDDRGISLGIKLGDLSDCDFCPFSDNPEFCSTHGGAEPPCAMYQEMSFREYEDSCVKSRYCYEKRMEEKRIERERKEEKARIKKAKARASRIRNYDLTKKISVLRKQKKALQEFLSMRECMSAVNSMFGQESRDEITGLTIYEEKIRGIDEEIERLVKQRKERNKQNRN